jgi:hypothetical protein
MTGNTNNIQRLLITFFLVFLFVVPATFGQPLAIMQPDPTFVMDAWMFGDPTNTIYFGNIAPYSVEDIEPASMRVNTIMEPLSYEIIAEMEGFIGPVMKLEIDRRDFIRGYGLVYDSTQHRYHIHCVLPGKCEIWVNGWVYLRGEGSGDANGDGRVNMLDVVFLITNIYNTNSSALPIRPGGDYNHDNRFDLLDVLGLIDKIMGIVRT